MILCSAALAVALNLSPAPDPDPEHVDAPRNAAEAALIETIHQRSTGRAFEAVFMDATVYVRIEPETYAALQQARAEGRTSLDGVQMKFWAVQPRPGQYALGVYLSEEAFNNHHSGHHWISLPGRAALGYAKANGFGVWVTDGGPAGERADGHTALWTSAEVGLVLSRNPAQAQAESD